MVARGNHRGVDAEPGGHGFAFGHADIEQWERARHRLYLRLRSESATQGCGPAIGPGLRAELVLELDRLVLPVTPSLLRTWREPIASVVADANANTWVQPLDWSTTTVTSGADIGSRLFVVGGGPFTSGIVADLRHAEIPGFEWPLLVSVPGDNLVVLGVAGQRRDRRSLGALAARLRRMQESLCAAPGPGHGDHRGLLWCHGRGRLTIFDPEEL